MTNSLLCSPVLQWLCLKGGSEKVDSSTAKPYTVYNLPGIKMSC